MPMLVMTMKATLWNTVSYPHYKVLTDKKHLQIQSLSHQEKEFRFKQQKHRLLSQLIHKRV
jgi:hypothetical protein